MNTKQEILGMIATEASEDIEKSRSKTPVIIWDGCYDEGWKGVITEKSFQHPAKMARGLITRIIRYMLEREWIHKGDTIGDCFGGIGTTGIVGAYHGLNVICNELEPTFVGLARDNFELHRTRWTAMGAPQPLINKGDSRNFDVIADAILTSPPFTMTNGGAQGINVDGYEGKKGKDTELGKRHYQGEGADREPGNIETLKSGNLDAAEAAGSPPIDYEVVLIVRKPL